MYDPKKAVERQGLPADLILDGIIIAIEDKKVRDFVKKLDKWKNPEQPAIKLTVEVMYNGNSHKFDKVVTYTEENGAVVYNGKSEFGKYKAKYGKLPEVGDKVKTATNKDGYLRLKLD